MGGGHEAMLPLLLQTHSRFLSLDLQDIEVPVTQFHASVDQVRRGVHPQ